MTKSHVPATDRSSFWERDPVVRGALRRALPASEWASAEPEFARIGALAADEVDRMAAIADQQRPTLRARDPQGNRVDEVIYHPAYRRLEDLAYRELRLVGVKYDPEARARGVAQRLGFGRTLLFGMGENGLLCPLCMTDGVARVLEASGDAELARRFIPRLCFGPGEARATGAMFLTEKAGGSDVGRCEVVARQTSSGWVLSGEKWFCSNVDAELILALARPEGAKPGTGGLGLFLIERARQSGDTFRIERLKDKLGTRSMPTGEVVLCDAPATQVGPLDAGFKQMAGMLNLSRLYNAVVSCAVTARAWLEAEAWSRERITFGKPVAAHPLMADVLADMRAEYAGVLALTFMGVQALDEADGGSSEAASLARATTPLAKLFTAKVAVATASEAVEALGGCGYIEDFPTARFLRDGQVLPIWEGTTNILSLDLVRVARQGDLDTLLRRARAALAGSTAAGLAAARDAARAKLDQAEAGFRELAGGAPPAGARRMAFTLARGVEVALLLEAAQAEPDGLEGDAALRLARASGPVIAC